jgi:hypothetical protein
MSNTIRLSGIGWPSGFSHDDDFDPDTRQQRIKHAAKRPLKRDREVAVPQVLGATPITGIRVFRVDLEEMILTSLSVGVGGRGTRYFPNEDYHATCPHANAVSNRQGFWGGTQVVPTYPKHRHTNKPLASCTCGVWVCKSRKALSTAVPYYGNDRGVLMVSAQVQLWGTVIEHEIGYRGEWARIIPASITKYPRNVPMYSDRWTKHVAHLREKYGAQPHN